MPFGAVASQTGGIHGEDGTHLPLADDGQQRLVAVTVHASGPRAPEVLVDHVHVTETELAGSLGQAVLAAPALNVLPDLVRLRLADVDIGRAMKM
jgi:hypothetical protein